MIPEPLHPAVVHFPIVLSVLLPISVIAAMVLISRGERVRRAWPPVMILALALLGSGWAAMETGEADEEAVEELVAESVIHEHEDVAQLFMGLALGTTLIVGLGFLGGKPGRAARSIAVIATLLLVGLGYRVGHTGGELVYVHGAAEAFVTDAARRGSPESERDDDEERGGSSGRADRR